MKTDFLVIGSGIAGLHCALTLAQFGKVLLVTKQSLTDSATSYAQGGIAAVFGKNDSIHSHIQDTLEAGKYHNKKESVTFLVRNGKKAILELQKYGVNFDKKENGNFATSYEAAHSYPRIFHASDFTGQEIEEKLVNSLLQTKNVEIWENAFTIDLYVKDNACFGAFILRDNEIIKVAARGTMLCTGGVGQVYTWTTNPKVATGDGIAMAARVKAKLTDLEFIQFHPTALQDSSSPLFLLSEALRGEGATLKDSTGKAFMKDFHPSGDLAPRDIVSRAVFHKQRTGKVFLDLRHKPKSFVRNRFPNIYRELLKRGYDLTTNLIPITPAAHFICGGIATDLYGRTSVQNLFAYGEVAATGIHGANRLASNSLLEGFVFSGQIAYCISELPQEIPSLPSNLQFFTINENKNFTRKVLQELMWNNVGIERTRSDLAQVIEKLTFVLNRLRQVPYVTREQGELVNMVLISFLIAKSAHSRQKSLGSHYVIA